MTTKSQCTGPFLPVGWVGYTAFVEGWREETEAMRMCVATARGINKNHTARTWAMKSATPFVLPQPRAPVVTWRAAPDPSVGTTYTSEAWTNATHFPSGETWSNHHTIITIVG